MLKSYILFFIKKYIRIPYRITRLSLISAVRKDGIEHSGYLAYLSILSLFPFLIFAVSLASSFGDSEGGVNLINFISDHLPQHTFNVLSERIMEISAQPPQSLLTVAIIGIIWTASSMVEGMRTIFNRSYRVFSPPTYLWRRFLSILQFFLIVFVILATSLILIVIPAILQKVETVMGVSFHINYDLFHLRSIVTFAILVISVTALYYLIPNINQKWNNTFPGAVFCVVYWWGISKLFYIYLANFNQFNLVYGSLAGIIGALIYFYLVSLGFIIGAEFNYNFRRAYKKRTTVNKKTHKHTRSI